MNAAFDLSEGEGGLPFGELAKPVFDVVFRSELRCAEACEAVVSGAGIAADEHCERAGSLAPGGDGSGPRTADAEPAGDKDDSFGSRIDPSVSREGCESVERCRFRVLGEQAR